MFWKQQDRPRLLPLKVRSMWRAFQQQRSSSQSKGPSCCLRWDVCSAQQVQKGLQGLLLSPFEPIKYLLGKQSSNQDLIAFLIHICRPESPASGNQKSNSIWIRAIFSCCLQAFLPFSTRRVGRESGTCPYWYYRLDTQIQHIFRRLAMRDKVRPCLLLQDTQGGHDRCHFHQKALIMLL